MKKLMFAFVLVLLLCGSAVAEEVFVSHGSAVVTGIQCRKGTWTDVFNLFVTNISGSEVTVKVTLFDHDGNDRSSICKVSTGSASGNGATSVSTGTGTFTLPAGATRIVAAPSSLNGMIYGHAVIEWTSADSRLKKALMATLQKTISYGDKSYGFMANVNGGQPF
ncbi:hypothetical protein [Salidesulfovibrio onnuriiensis]|uniref:hypothetical protein n=1 Tax=Salidesulfovibrio onnuriiensis TaxID=2583823 RepID=UPI0011CB8A0B|nr:hypothetical protein [Salidesulfovibrio onnuriiensis]